MKLKQGRLLQLGFTVYRHTQPFALIQVPNQGPILNRILKMQRGH